MCNALPAPRCAHDALKNWNESKARLDLAKQRHEDLPTAGTEQEVKKQQASFDWRDRQFSVNAAAQARTARIQLKQEAAGNGTLSAKQRAQYQAVVERADNLMTDPEVWEAVQREHHIRKTIAAYKVKGPEAFKGNARLIRDTFTFWQNLPIQEDKYRLNQLTPEQQKLMEKALRGDLSKDYLDKKKVNVSGDPREPKQYTVKTDTWPEATAGLRDGFTPAPLPPRPGTPTYVPPKPAAPTKPKFGDLRTRS